MRVFLRGGQIIMHSYRMLNQIIKQLLRFGIIAVLFVSILKVKSQVTAYDFKVYYKYHYSNLLYKANLGNKKVKIKNSRNEILNIKAIDIISNNSVILVVEKINHIIKNSILKSFGYGILTILIAFLVFVFHGVILSRRKVLRGKIMISHADLKKKVRRYNLVTNLADPSYYKILFNSILNQNYSKIRSITIADIPYPLNMETTHTLITGAPGTGKTVMLSKLIKQVRSKGQKAIIYDYMGVYTKRFFDPKKGDILINPLDKRSANWSLIKECEKLSDFDSIAKAFIPEKTSGDPYWENAARTVFVEVLRYLRSQNKLTNEELKEVFLSENEDLFEKIISSSGGLKKILPDNSDKTKGSILSVMTTYVKSLQYLSDSKEEYFSIKNWIEDDTKTGFLVIPSSANQHESLKPIISSILEISINNLLSLKQSSHRRVWIFLDELPTLHYLPSLQPGLAESRQFGGSFVLGIQLMAQLRNIYGRDLAQSVSGSCRNRVIFSTPDEETAHWCSNSLGKVETEEIREAASYGSHEMRDGINLSKYTETKNIVLSSEIMNLENLNCYIKFGNGFPVCKAKINYENYDEISPKFIENVKINQIKIESLEDNVRDDELEESIERVEHHSDEILNEDFELEEEAYEKNYDNIIEERDTESDEISEKKLIKPKFD